MSPAIRRTQSTKPFGLFQGETLLPDQIDSVDIIVNQVNPVLSVNKVIISQLHRKLLVRVGRLRRRHSGCVENFAETIAHFSLECSESGWHIYAHENCNE